MKDSTKIKLKKALIIGGSVVGIVGLFGGIYYCGHADGEETGYAKGFEAGKSEDGDQNKYNEGIDRTVRAHARFLYDPFNYNPESRYISDGVYVSSKEFSSLLNDEDKKKAEEIVGSGFHARMVYTRKPDDYDELIRSLPPHDAYEAPRAKLPTPSIEEQPDVPEVATEVEAVTNELGEEVG